MDAKTTLKDLGYRFDDRGVLRRIEDNSQFVFTNQEDYVRIGDAMTKELYSILENRYALTRVDIPNCSRKYGKGLFMFRDGYDWSADKLILNESLEVGSQLPYIERALKNDWGVIVCSTNTDEELCEYASRHLCAVYEKLLKDSASQRIFVVAHSRGGPDFASAYTHFKDDKRFSVVCLTDSVDFHLPQCSHSPQSGENPVFINWKADSNLQQSALSIGDILDEYSRVHQVYAGTTEHERSSHSAFKSVFHVLENWNSGSHFPKLLVEAAGLASLVFFDSDYYVRFQVGVTET
ncbi:unnamed protein product [Heligmosomoides polygyrus]|uniref:Alpha/beta hydrolase n=1 Tax=Heligmosomoides polygyrus TaxID=6339 RepID=A0A3P7ZPJ6_HELPZ|nr:unnamed protein product [Heligmosomoides polygyrus]